MTHKTQYCYLVMTSSFFSNTSGISLEHILVNWICCRFKQNRTRVAILSINQSINHLRKQPVRINDIK